MNSTRSSLRRMFYFKKIGSEKKRDLMRELEGEPDGVSRARALEYETDGFKLYLFILICAIISVSAAAPVLFVMEAALGYGLLIYLSYALYAAELVSILYGVFSRRIRIREYICHIVLFVLQLLLTAGGTLFVFAKLAESLGSF